VLKKFGSSGGAKNIVEMVGSVGNSLSSYVVDLLTSKLMARSQSAHIR
jgi:hypothetical protein